MLPFHIIETYRLYKQDSSKVLKWLSSHAGPASRVHDSTVKQFVEIAEAVVADGISVPQDLYTSLSGAIQARHVVSVYYSQLEVADQRAPAESTRSHQHFTESLRRILKILFPTKPQKERRTRESHTSSDTPVSEYLCERLASLTIEDVEQLEEDVEVNEEEEETFLPSDTTQLPKHGAYDENGSPHDLILKDDDLACLIEFANQVAVGYPYLFRHKTLTEKQEYDQVCQRLKDYWLRVSQGKISILQAGLFTDHAFLLINDFNHNASHIINSSYTHPELLRLYRQSRHLLTIAEATKNASSSCTTFRSGPGLILPWIAISHSLGVDRPKNVFEPPERVIPSSAVHLDEEEYASLDNSRIVDFLQWRTLSDMKDTSIDGHCARFDALKDSLQHKITPLILLMTGAYKVALEPPGFDGSVAGDRRYFYDIIGLLKAMSNASCSWIHRTMVFQLQSEFEIFQTFLHGDGTGGPSRPNCRVEVLRFAGEVQSAVNGLVQDVVNGADPGLCGKLELHVVKYLNCVKEYISFKAWDLFHQSPCTAAAHLEILHRRAYHLGTVVCISNTRAGTSLFVYNMLRQLKYIEAIPFYDRMCEIMIKPVFLGQLTQQHFRSCWRRYCGGKVNRKAMQRFPATANAAIDRVAEPTSCRFDEHKKFMRTLHHGIHYYAMLGAEFVDLLARNDVSGKAKSASTYLRQFQQTCKASGQSEIHQKLDLLSESMAKDFEGDFPLARINWFAVYKTLMTAYNALFPAFGCCDAARFIIPYPDSATTMFVSMAQYVEVVCEIADREIAHGPLALEPEDREVMCQVKQALLADGRPNDLKLHLWKAL